MKELQELEESNPLMNGEREKIKSMTVEFTFKCGWKSSLEKIHAAKVACGKIRMLFPDLDVDYRLFEGEGRGEGVIKQQPCIRFKLISKTPIMPSCFRDHALHVLDKINEIVRIKKVVTFWASRHFDIDD